MPSKFLEGCAWFALTVAGLSELAGTIEYFTGIALIISGVAGILSQFVQD